MEVTVHTMALEDTQLAKSSSKSYAGPCPDPECRCKHDGFYVKYDASLDKWLFGCRGCWQPEEILTEETAKQVIGRKQAGDKRGLGDEVNYLHHFRGMTYQQARAFLEGHEVPNRGQASTVHAGKVDKYLTDDWQHATHTALTEHCARLWSGDTTALDHARKRGLTDKTIRDAELAYSIQGGIPRLLIPVKNEGRYYAIYRRDLRPDCPKGERWKDAPGGTKSELYLADILKIRRGFPVVLVEDAFSALSIWQECSDLVNVVGTGSANCGKLIKWVARLALAPRVLIALDADDAGDKEANFWLDRLQNATRLRPKLKDPNDMLMAGINLRDWITDALASELATTCCICGQSCEDTTDLFYYDADGLMYCSSHWQGHGPADTLPALESEPCQPEPEPAQPPRIVKTADWIELDGIRVWYEPGKLSIQDAAREYAQKSAQEDRETFHERIARNAAMLAGKTWAS